jgi:hypothetical protein
MRELQTSVHSDLQEKGRLKLEFSKGETKAYWPLLIIFSLRVVDMVKIAWICRHPILEAQKESILKIFGENVTIIQFTSTFVSAEYLYSLLKNAEVTHAVVVLPLSMIQHLVKHKDIVWLYCDMNKVHDNCPGEGCKLFDKRSDVLIKPGTTFPGTFNYKRPKHYRFVGFKKIAEVTLKLEDL